MDRVRLSPISSNSNATQRNVERDFYVVHIVQTATSLRREKNEDQKDISATDTPVHVF